MRRTTILSVAATLLLASCGTGTDEGREVEPPGVPQTPVTVTGTAPSPTAALEGGTVTVVIKGVEGAEGNKLAGVVFKGVGLRGNPNKNGVGGFAVAIDTDPFSTTQLVHQPNPAFNGPFPFVLDDVLTLEPGRYTLVLVAAPRLHPYNRWVPAQTRGLGSCLTMFSIPKDGPVVVRLNPATLWYPRDGGFDDAERYSCTGG